MPVRCRRAAAGRPTAGTGYWSRFSASPTCSSSSVASASASSFGCFCTVTGPSVTFCRTVLCGKRLCDWNTKPLCARYLRSWSFDTGLEKSTSTPSSPPTRITPASGLSSALSARSSVVLPEPDGPMMAVDVPRGTVNDTPLSTSLSPKALCTPSAVILSSRGSVIAPHTFPADFQLGSDRTRAPGR